MNLPLSVITMSLPVLGIHARAVEKGIKQVLTWTDATQHQADPVHRRQKEEEDRQQETAMIGLTHTAVDPDWQIDQTVSHGLSAQVMVRPPASLWQDVTGTD